MTDFDYQEARRSIRGIIREDGKERDIQNNLSAYEKHLLLELIEFAPRIEPSQWRLKVRMSCSERQIRNIMHSCETKGVLRIQRDNGRRSRYEICFESIREVEGCKRRRNVAAVTGGPVTVDPKTPAQFAAVEPKSGVVSTQTPAQFAGPPRHSLPTKQTSEADKGS